MTRRWVLPLLVGVALLSGCALSTTAPGGDEASGADAPQVVVTVLDDTDKAYTDQVGDLSSLYRDIANKVASGLSGRGVTATTYDEPGARDLVVRLTRVRISDDSSSSTLNVRLRAEFSAELDGWSRRYDRDDVVQRPFSGASSSDIRELVATQVAGDVTSDPDLLEALQK